MVRRALIGLLLASSAWCQTATLALQGDSINLRSNGQTVAAVQFSLNIPVGFAPQLVIGAAALAAGKQIACSWGGSTAICVVYGMNLNLIADGQVAQLAGAVPAGFSLAAPVAATPAGDAVPIVILGFSPCDLNQDGQIDLADVDLLVSAIKAAKLPNGAPAPAAFDLSGDGSVDVVDVQRVVNAAVPGGSCRVGK
jgi:hypothetical protein